VLTGKGLEFGGSYVRTEATGYGLIYFTESVCKANNTELNGKRVVVSGAGNVALHAAQKAIQKGASVVTLSNSRGLLYCEEGFSEADITWAIKHHTASDNILVELEKRGAGVWYSEKTPWHIKCDIALPCATQNELHESNARELLKNGCSMVLEGANMPCSMEAQEVFINKKITYVPGKASNAGGVALSGLEMSQNAMFSQRSAHILDKELQSIMQGIHERCIEEAKLLSSKDGYINYMKGANIAAFRRLADAMVAQGV